MEELKLKQVLKRLMEERDVSITRLSKATGVPQATISSYLVGGGSGKPAHIRALARFFSVSMEYLLWGEDSREPGFQDVALEQVFSGWLKVNIERAIPTKRKGEK